MSSVETVLLFGSPIANPTDPRRVILRFSSLPPSEGTCVRLFEVARSAVVRASKLDSVGMSTLSFLF